MTEAKTVGGVDGRLLLGMLHLGGIAPLFLAAGIVTTVMFGSGIIAGDEETFCITTGIGILIAVLLITLAVPGIVTGVGLIRNKSWAPAMALVMAVFTFLAIPVGTIISILTIWIFREELDKMLGRGKPSIPIEARRSQ